MEIHLFFDILSFIVASLWIKYKIVKPNIVYYDESQKQWYYSVLVVGFVLGSVIIGTLNTYVSLDKFIVSKSVVGAIFGAIIAIEIYKIIINIQGSTGAYFVPSLALGITIGRIGCFMTGLDDYTYGTITTLPWGVDFGDGIFRHPVQLYESVTMFVFFFYAMAVYKKDREKFEKSIFFIFIFVYATQRFVWEFLKPYAEVALGLNIFQWVCLILIGYAIYHYKGVRYGTLFTKV